MARSLDRADCSGYGNAHAARSRTPGRTRDVGFLARSANTTWVLTPARFDVGEHCTGLRSRSRYCVMRDKDSGLAVVAHRLHFTPASKTPTPIGPTAFLGFEHHKTVQFHSRLIVATLFVRQATNYTCHCGGLAAERLPSATYIPHRSPFAMR